MTNFLHGLADEFAKTAATRPIVAMIKGLQKKADGPGPKGAGRGGTGPTPPPPGGPKLGPHQIAPSRPQARPAPMPQGRSQQPFRPSGIATTPSAKPPMAPKTPILNRNPED